MVNGFEGLSPDDVVSMTYGEILIPHHTFKVGEFKAKMKAVLPGNNELKDKWLTEGQSCEILKPGAKHWQKGKVRITLEFCPDEPEIAEKLVENNLEIIPEMSPLDDLRHQIKQIQHQ
jgi:hypothetical protein